MCESYDEPLHEGGFVGYAIRCLLCCRPWSERPYLSLVELVLFWGVPADVARRARWASLSFLWLSSRSIPTQADAA